MLQTPGSRPAMIGTRSYCPQTPFVVMAKLCFNAMIKAAAMATAAVLQAAA